MAESVFIAGLFVLAAGELAAIAARRGDAAEAERCRAAASRMTAAVRRARLGRRLVPARLRPLRRGRSARPRTTRAGSSSSRRGCASWPASASTDGRARARARVGPGAPGDAARDRRSSSRPTRATALKLGEISSYPPGYKENAGVFCHTNPWVMIAETIVGNGDGRPRLLPPDQPLGARGDLRRPPLRAVRLRPDDRRPRRADPRRGEELVAHRDGRLELRRRSPSGSSASGPSTTACGSTPACPPPGATSRSTRRFRGATYRITVRKPAGTGGRVVRLVVDGRPVAGNLAPLPPAPGAEIAVEAFVEPPVGAAR